ncbi:MAG: GIY-YIG nuclease family protein [Thermomicrobiales bacterium]
MADYFTYIMSNDSKTLYTGMTNNLERRVWQHKAGSTMGFTTLYRCTALVWCEAFPDPLSAIAREKQIKGWIRAKKLALIEEANPGWADLSAEWEGMPPTLGRTASKRRVEILPSSE